HRFAQAARSSYREKDNALGLRLQRLDSLSPLKTLARGYSVTRAVQSARLKAGEVVRDATALAAGETVEVIARRGRFNATVAEVFAESVKETID
ncbi:MAG TPA: exodeoxyribonuclease VII large subunit, partial [candidate division Zixibacteria bacterium]|nr:exodeoxyribonuclease VII large subunit [candidate division Zixibacteria bacterium]